MKVNISQECMKKIEEAIGPANIRQSEPMSLHTTMQVGGAAEWFFTPESEEGICALLAALKQENIPCYILGNGSNVIFPDEGFAGAVICLTEHYTGYRILREEGDLVLVAVKAGTRNKDFSDAMISEGLGGFEFASGIPGSIGGATAMNAGAYDGELRQIVREVTLLDEDLQIRTKSGEEMDFGYRHSLVSDRAAIVLETVFALHKDDPAQIQSRVEELTRRREEKQPLEYPSCGSTFKRPEGYFAGKLISDAGLKGFRLGGAQVSEKHAGFIINRDHATAKEIRELIAYVQKKVKESQGVLLECEVKIL